MTGRPEDRDPRASGSDELGEGAHRGAERFDEPRGDEPPLESPPLPPAEINYAPPPSPRSATPYLPDATWSFGQVIAVILSGVVAATVAGAIAVGAGAEFDNSYVVFGVVFPAQVLGSLFAAGYLSTTRGTGSWVRDFGLAVRWRDVWGVGGGVGLQIAALIVTAALLTALGGDVSPSQDVADIAENAAGGAIALAFIGTVLLAPLIEEIIYRGMLLSALRRRMGRHPAVLISAAVFALVHLLDPGTLLLQPGLFLIGAGLGYAALRGRSLSLPLFLHAGVNLTGFTLTQFADELQRWAENVESLVMLVAPIAG